MTTSPIPITVAYGDGIGPEIMTSVLKILKEAQARLHFHVIEIGEKIYLKGVPTGIEPSAWEILRKTKVFLKAPITTPQGSGFKSLNVTIRTTLGLYANIRPCVAYSPFISTKHPGMDVVIVRENEEDLYTGIEYKQSPDLCKSLKLISRPGSEKIVRYAFEYAKHYQRKKVTCFVKDNIMKLSDGLFHQVFKEISSHYPEIQAESWIVDIGAAKLADTPEAFDVIVMPNLYGDILSDVAAQISGSVGLAGSANIGDHGAMFEAIHGSAPRRAGQNVANPSGLLLAAISMLIYLGENVTAERIHNAWLKTIEEGIHTYDIFKQGISQQKVGTKEFAEAVIQRLGKTPQKLQPVTYTKSTQRIKPSPSYVAQHTERKLVGIDIFIYAQSEMDRLIHALTSKPFTALPLCMVSNRGARVWPDGQPETFCIDQWRLRFMHADQNQITQQDTLDMLSEVLHRGYDIIATENLYHFDGKPGFSSPSG